VTKQLVLPTFDLTKDHKMVKLYATRSTEDEEMSLLDFARSHRTEGVTCAQRYKIKNRVLVGVKHRSFFDAMFFWQHTILTIPFRKVDDLLPHDFESYPEDLK